MILTKAVSGLARSNATRSGWPVLQGVKVPLYALSNVGRSGATRSNYTSSNPFISVGGIQRGWARGVIGQGVIAESLTKSDAINNTPVTLAFSAYGWVPVEGADVVVTLGSTNNLQRQFGGTIVSTRHRYDGRPLAQNMFFDAQCIDYTWALDNRKVSGNFTNASVAAIAASLMTSAPAGYTLLVDADIGAQVLDQITMSEQSLTSAFAQLAKRVGGDFHCDYLKVVHLFYENTAVTAPSDINAVHRSLATISFTRDLSQVITRCLGNFGGSNAMAAIMPGDVWLPVDTAGWYLPQGGTVIVGQQRVTYSGLVVGGGGSLVGPGAAPTGVPNAALLPGVGVDVGSHDYAVTFKTASGESVAGPRVTVAVSVFAAPSTYPTPGPPGPGATGPDPGVHDYAIAYVISTGETTPGPRISASTDLTPPPASGPTPDSVLAGGAVDLGTHDYAATFVTATGETTASPIGGQASTGNLAAPGAPGFVSLMVGPGPDSGAHDYVQTFLRPEGETNSGPRLTVTTGAAVPAPTVAPVFTSLGAPGSGGPDYGNLYYAYTYVGVDGGETAMSPVSAVILQTSNNTSVNLHNIAPSPANGITKRNIYRNQNDTGLRFIATINDNTTQTFTDNVGFGAIGGYPPAPHPPISRGVNLTLQLGPAGAGVTGRRLYRTNVGGTSWGLIATIGDNTTTAYFDALPDSGLVAPGPPASNTTTGGYQTIHVASIPLGSAGVLQRKLYRRSGGAGLRYLATVADNATTVYTDTAANAALGAAPPVANSATLRQIPLSAIPVGNSFVTARKIYRTPANTGGGTLKLVATIADNTTTTFLDTVNDASLGAAALTVSTAQTQQVQLSSIPLGAAAVTARVVYRTKVGASQLQLLVTIADNTTTTYVDIKADATLGANVPISDTSLLQQPTGNVLAGSTSLPVATVAGFLATGGWVKVGSQSVRYSSISGNALLGIPATGPGSIGATITWNTTAVAAAMLTGIPTTGLGVIKYPILQGDTVNIFVQVDAPAAQAAVRAQLAGSDGIIEDELQDGRLSYVEGVDRCQARLDLLAALDSDGKVGIITVSYVCRDINTQAGATVSINLGPPLNLRGDFLIQRVGVAQFNIPNLNPTYTVEASSIRFSAEEMLRLLRQGAM